MFPDKKTVGARLRAAREASPYWSRAEMARRLRAAADPLDRPGLPHVASLRDQIKQWEAGKWRPSARYQKLYVRATGVPAADLFGATSEPAPPPESDHRSAPLTNPVGIGNHGPVAPELVGYFRHQLPGHYSADMWLGPHLLIPTVDAQTRLLQQLIRGADSSVRHHLLEMGVAYAALLGWLYQDAADLNRSGQWRAEALDMAHRHGDPQLVSYALANKAMHAVDIGDGTAIIDYAEAALEEEGRLSPKVRVLSLVHLAHGHGYLGDRYAADRAFDRAEAIVDQVDEEMPWGNACRRTPKYMDIQRATAYGRAGAHDDAARLWGEILNDQPADYRRDNGVFRARQAAALAAAADPEPDKVVEIAAGAVTACTETGSRRLRRELVALPSHASAWAQTPHGRELAEIIASVS